MALSNWDTLCVDKHGNSINGLFEYGNTIVKIYKNSLHIHDTSPDSRTGDFVTMTIENCSLIYKGIHIESIRGPQSGIYVVCWTYDETIDRGIDKLMIGCGVYGYDNNGDWIGVTEESKQFLKDWITKKEPDYTIEEAENMVIEYELDDSKKEEFIKDALTPRFVWPQQIAETPLDNAMRFNQGDAFFADKLKCKLPATEIGEQEAPILRQMLGQSK